MKFYEVNPPGLLPKAPPCPEPPSPTALEIARDALKMQRKTLARVIYKSGNQNFIWALRRVELAEQHVRDAEPSNG